MCTLPVQMLLDSFCGKIINFLFVFQVVLQVLFTKVINYQKC